MTWLIAKKEILDNIITLRFALIHLLLLILMALNALIYTKGDETYLSEMEDYRKRVADVCRHHYRK